MCGICERIKETKEGKNPFLVKELETGYVVIGDFQHFKGYTLFLYKDHVVELFDLDENTRAKHLREMTLVAEAVKNAFGAEKMNYECLGNGEGGAHIHCSVYYDPHTFHPSDTTIPVLCRYYHNFLYHRIFWGTDASGYVHHLLRFRDIHNSFSQPRKRF